MNTVDALLATILVSDQLYLLLPLQQPRFDCDLNFVMNSSRKATATTAFWITRLDFSFVNF